MNCKKIMTLFLATAAVLTSNIMAKGTEPPKINGRSGIVMDISTGEIIYTNNPDLKSYPASTTKLLTALLLAENKKKTDELSYTEAAKKQPEYSLNLNMHSIAVGEKFSAEAAMDSLLIYSANDIAYMIADNVSGNANKFKDLMNSKIKEFGLKNTHFVTPNGLHNDDHYTTAYDLTVIARHAFQNKWVSETMAKKKSKITTSAGTTLLFEPRNRLLGIDGCVGGKTGYTAKAGRCLVAFFNRDGKKYVGVVMHSIYDSKDSYVFEDMKKIVNWSYKQNRVTLHKKNSVLKTETLKYKPLVFFGPEVEKKVPVTVKADVKYYKNDLNVKEAKEIYNLDNLSIWKLKEGQPIGTYTLKEREAVKTFKLYSNVSKGDIFKDNILLYAGVFVGVVAIIGLILFIVFKIRSLSRRRIGY